MKAISLFFGMILSTNPLMAQDKVETVTEQIEGMPMFIQSSSLFNWRGSCRDFGSNTTEMQVLEYDCGTPRCTDNGLEIICSSHGIKKVIRKVTPLPKLDD